MMTELVAMKVNHEKSETLLSVIAEISVFIVNAQHLTKGIYRGGMLQDHFNQVSASLKPQRTQMRRIKPQ